MSDIERGVNLQQIGERLRTEFRAEPELPKDMHAALEKLRQSEGDTEDEVSAAYSGQQVMTEERAR